MIYVNGKELKWKPELTFSEILVEIGYKIPNPRVAVRLNGESIPKSRREGTVIPDGAEIQIINILCGG